LTAIHPEAPNTAAAASQSPTSTGTAPPLELSALEAGLGPAALALLRRHALVRPLVKAMLVDRAVAGVELSREEQQQALAQAMQRNGVADASAMTRLCAINGCGQADLQRQLLLPLLRARHCRQAFEHLAETTFLRQKDNLDQVVYSLIRVSDPHLALELYHRLTAGEATFADLAHQYAEGPERQSRGLVGPKPLSQAHPVLAERLRTAQPGVVQMPIRAADLWLVTRLEQLIPAKLNEATIQQICEQLFDNWLEQRATEILAGTGQPA
jgi:parvulin-like peptidyl-prolyl isomerase